ncbi:MAG: hypothetical protein AAF149_13730 [Bacteroidota bacterium]
MNIFLNSYYPITWTRFGRNASVLHNIHPLEDGSIRREPDFQHSNPGISGLCRPRSMNDIGLSEGDIMIYKTNGTHFLSAILRVIYRYNNHQAAADWFIQNRLPIPSNNVTVDSLSIKLSHAKDFHDYHHRIGRNERSDQRLTERWDEDYQDRASRSTSSYFFITEPIYNAVSANLQPEEFIEITSILREYYSTVPNTAWRPQPISQACYDDILLMVS